MTLTITGDISSGPVGPGYTLVVHTDLVGPIPVDDFIVININAAGTGFTLDSGSGNSNGTHNATATIGYGPHGGGGDKREPISTGDAVDVQVQWLHGNFSLVEDHTFSGFTWDPLGGLYAVVEHESNVNVGTKLDQILSAVYRPFPTA